MELILDDVLVVNNTINIKLANSSLYTCIDKSDYEYLKKLKNNITFHLNNGYAACLFDNKNWLLHRLIWIKIHKQDDYNKMSDCIDHIDRNKLNNCFNNLRCISKQANARNIIRTNATSQYHNVYKQTNNLFHCSIKINDMNIWTIYKNEHYAAYQVNLWIDKYKLIGYSYNDIDEDELKDFESTWNENKIHKINYIVEYFYTFIKQNPTTKKFYIEFTYKQHKFTFEDDNEEDLKIQIKNALSTFNKNKCKLYEESEIAYIMIKNNKVLIDKDKYDDIIQFTWCMDNGYVKASNSYKLHRFVMGCYDENNENYKTELHVDHINNNKLDNRIQNLRFVTRSENNLNRRCHCNNKLQIKNLYYININKISCHRTLNEKRVYIGSSRDINKINLYNQIYEYIYNKKQHLAFMDYVITEEQEEEITHIYNDIYNVEKMKISDIISIIYNRLCNIKALSSLNEFGYECISKDKKPDQDYYTYGIHVSCFKHHDFSIKDKKFGKTVEDAILMRDIYNYLFNNKQFIINEQYIDKFDKFYEENRDDINIFLDLIINKDDKTNYKDKIKQMKVLCAKLFILVKPEEYTVKADFRCGISKNTKHKTFKYQQMFNNKRSIICEDENIDIVKRQADIFHILIDQKKVFNIEFTVENKDNILSYYNELQKPPINRVLVKNIDSHLF